MNNLNRRLLFENKQEYHLYIGNNYKGSVKTHYHGFNHCTLLLSGDLAYFQQGETLRMKPGDVLITPTQCSHSMYIFTEDTSYFCLSFSQTMVDELTAYFPRLKQDFSNIPSVVHMPQHEINKLQHILSSIMDEQNCSNDNTFETGSMLTISALILMIRDVYTTDLLENRQPSVSNYKEVVDCIHYIGKNLDHDIEIEDLIKIAALSQSSLYKAFKLHTGKAIKQYIAERRIEESIHLLNMGKSINDASKAVGFNDFSTYYRNFIKYVGISPSKSLKRLNNLHTNGSINIPDNLKACIGCALCSTVCKMGAITMVKEYPKVDYDKCSRCGNCISACLCGCLPIQRNR